MPCTAAAATAVGAAAINGVADIVVAAALAPLVAAAVPFVGPGANCRPPKPAPRPLRRGSPLQLSAPDCAF